MKNSSAIRQMFADFGLSAPLAIACMRDTLAAGKENYSLIKSLLDRKSQTREEIKLLQLELLIRALEREV